MLVPENSSQFNPIAAIFDAVNPMGGGMLAQLGLAGMQFPGLPALDGSGKTMPGAGVVMQPGPRGMTGGTVTVGSGPNQKTLAQDVATGYFTDPNGNYITPDGKQLFMNQRGVITDENGTPVDKYGRPIARPNT